MNGLLRLRLHFHSLGLNQGFQWIDGSFLEDIENHEDRSPRDVDVVTFVVPVENLTEHPEFPDNVDHGWLKQHFLVDHYFVELNLPPHQLVDQAAYWYSLWSHRRTLQWKGFLQVDLAEQTEGDCLAILENLSDEESGK